MHRKSVTILYQHSTQHHLQQGQQQQRQQQQQQHPALHRSSAAAITIASSSSASINKLITSSMCPVALSECPSAAVKCPKPVTYNTPDDSLISAPVLFNCAILHPVTQNAGPAGLMAIILSNYLAGVAGCAPGEECTQMCTRPDACPGTDCFNDFTPSKSLLPKVRIRDNLLSNVNTTSLACGIPAQIRSARYKSAPICAHKMMSRKFCRSLSKY